jgi:enterochelin esterase family protein
VFVTYSDIEGGYEGVGNIDIDPIFSDTVYFYLDSLLSPCIDAGNTDSIFNDPEDPMNPGYALWPAEGTLRNDMGAYGGNVESGDQQELLGPLFNAFVKRVNAAPQQDKQAFVDSFLSSVPSFPFIEENTIANYIYTGTVGSVSVPGDANGWNSNLFPMTQLEGTQLWYRQAVYESEARLDYKFVLNGSNWILDPRNPNTVTGGFGPNSELAMPAYVQPPEIEFNPGIPQGTVHTFLFTSDTLNNSRNIRVYTPPGYDSHPNYHYPMVLLHDGLEYITLGSAINILDNLLAESKMNPVIAVFVPPVNRNEEYAFSQTQQFESFIVDELMPHIDTTYRTNITPDKRAMLGPSFAGLITTQICYKNPDIFGLAAPYSPAYWPNNMAVMNTVINGPTENIKWYIDWGTYDIGVMIDGRIMRDELINKGYEIKWKEWFEGHSWGTWRAHVDEALMYFFPKTVDVADEETVPTEYALSQNYPNPFNPSTRIKYSIPESGLVTIKLYDIIGNEITTLVNEEKLIGRYTIHFNASSLASGVYFYQIRAGGFLETKKMMLLK